MKLRNQNKRVQEVVLALASMDFDAWSTQSTSALTMMTSAESGGYERSTMSLMHSLSSVSQSNEITFRPSERQAIRSPSRSLCISQETYTMIEQGNKIKVYDKHSMTYMVVWVHRMDPQISKGIAMDEEVQSDFTNNFFQFSAQCQEKVINAEGRS